MDQASAPPPPTPAPQYNQSSSLPSQANTNHLNQTPAQANNQAQQSADVNFNQRAQAPPATPAPDPAPNATDIPPPSPGRVLDSIIPQDPPPMTGKSVFDDQKPNSKNIYSSSVPSIFFRNLIAGFARALGSMIVYFIVLATVGYYSLNYIWPEIKPLIASFQKIANMQTQTQPNSVDPQQVQQLINQMQQPAN